MLTQIYLRRIRQGRLLNYNVSITRVYLLGVALILVGYLLVVLILRNGGGGGGGGLDDAGSETFYNQNLYF